jgi:dTMP kinase
MSRGKFITLEGIDGAGKSSHLDFLVQQVKARGDDAVLTREPGGTPAGEKIREVVLHAAMNAKAEALMMFAARGEHVASVIEPALAAGRWVVCDRFTDSTYAYQGGGKGLDATVVERLEAIAHPGLQPDATLLFDIDPADAAERQRAQGRAPDQFEGRSPDFHVRVRNAYLERARRNPARIHVIDASGSLEQVRAAVAQVMKRLLA